jgi:transcriptional regulator with XRE-family HTH domain
MTFSEDLRAARKNAGMSQSELAGTRCSLSYISHLESGRRSPTPEIVSYLEERLGLARGALGTAVGSGVHGHSDQVDLGRGTLSGAEILALYVRAEDHWRQGALGSAMDLALEARKGLPRNGLSELRWLIEALRVKIEIDQADFQEASFRAERLAEESRRSGVLELAAQQYTLAARAARSIRDLRRARLMASHGLTIAEDPSVSLSTRAAVLTGAIACHHEDSNDLIPALGRLLSRVENRHLKGQGAWLLGTRAFERGDAREGRQWHKDADRYLSPAADYRRWVDFPTDAAVARLEAGVSEDVVDLLAEGRKRASLLDSPEERARVGMAEARWLRMQGRSADGAARLLGRIVGEELAPIVEGDARMIVARLLMDDDDAAGSRESALTAARLYTKAGALEKARSAWAHVDRILSGEQ